jgi:hypothetical protein
MKSPDKLRIEERSPMGLSHIGGLSSESGAYFAI